MIYGRKTLKIAHVYICIACAAFILAPAAGVRHQRRVMCGEAFYCRLRQLLYASNGCGAAHMRKYAAVWKISRSLLQMIFPGGWQYEMWINFDEIFTYFSYTFVLVRCLCLNAWFQGNEKSCLSAPKLNFLVPFVRYRRNSAYIT